MGRMIDADALQEKWCTEMCRKMPGCEEDCAYWSYIHSAPTIEERKGRWIITKRNGILCGVCHSGFRRMPTLEGKPMFNYCPLCGAKMEGADNE